LSEELKIGERFGDFEILAEAGRGGMGVVYRARQISLQRPVALKVITPEISDQPDFRSRFIRESRLAASIDHPNVVSVHGAGEIDGLSYIAMQWIEGTNVADAIVDGPLELARVVAIGEQMGSALDAAHATGLIHRDIKPGNILLRKLGRRDHAYLTDFGIAKRSEIDQGTDLTRAGSVVGTINYMAPEQIQGHATPSSDLYALGCVLFEAATGQRPFERESEVAVMWAQMHAPRPRPSQLRPGLNSSFDDVIERALAVDPADRFADGAALAEALRRAGAGVPLPPPPGGRPAPPPPPPTVPPPPAQPTAEQPRRRPPTAATAALPADRDRDEGGPSRGLLIGGLVALALVAAVVVALLLSGSDSGGGGTTPGGSTPTAPTTPDDNGGGGNGGGGKGTEQSVAEARSEIESLLHSYEAAYSSEDLNAMGALLSEDVTRVGLAAGSSGCVTSRGKAAVLDTYAGQFDANPASTYTLTGLEPSAIDVSGESASSDLGYSISSGASGSISFGFTRVDDRWLISDIKATC